MEQSKKILKQYWSFEHFRPLQEDIIDSSIYGDDVLALLPTGGGKSLCFQIPGLAREGITLVISPLIALMHDQVNQLKNRNIRAAALSSELSFREIDILLDNARFGGLDFLYLSPERLQTRIFIERFKLMQVALIVVDEAHCISEWGHDFRPSYRQIADLRTHHPQVPMMALTATATPEVKQDILEQLQLKKPRVFEGNYERKNLSYEIYEVKNKLNTLIQLAKKIPGASGIVYCQKRKSVKFVAQQLDYQGIKVGIYHGGLSASDRKLMMKRWIDNELQIMVATNAFGMGIDKADVRFVSHYEFPDNIEAYFQEAGRAGRDGEKARTFIFYEEEDLERMSEGVARQFPEIDTVKLVYRSLCNYLSIAVGSGAGISYPLPINDLCEKFKLDVVDAYQSLKILEMNGDLEFSENFFHPTRLRIIINNASLYSFQLKNEKLDPLLILLTRSYPGIFDFHFEINEYEFCKRLKISVAELDNQLRLLEMNGVIDIHWKSDLPQVTFIHERLPDSYLRIQYEVYERRKRSAMQRWESMQELLTTTQCRSQYISAYFGQNQDPCGICDNCIRKTSAHTEETLTKEILAFLDEPKSQEEIENRFETFQKERIIQVLYHLRSEEIISLQAHKYRKN